MSFLESNDILDNIKRRVESAKKQTDKSTCKICGQWIRVGKGYYATENGMVCVECHERREMQSE